ncbi:peptidoglycan editing factor PgeF [Pseudoalteromonas sp. BDTF-M6]|uniref:peptidoglycan editing factor PgeF n=1 Tax=Pseudoalteromonas sp. BDTF-M6 TaxID=2796132 RepID=UPI001BAE622E|nr:peptidoglycan editing factor PgeF [Pseudoalteromonas sp. BDTF-M6]MBS3796239.1 peptidoglycan editing factor PgeF [Pseudoalteromonas sp. BDTF-M6]
MVTKTIKSSLFEPNWPAAAPTVTNAPAQVGALQSTRQGGVSLGQYQGFNLGEHVGDDTSHVAQNRALLNAHLPAPAHFVQQVHGIHIHTLVDNSDTAHIEADGLFTRCAHTPLAIMTADCLPVLLASDDGEEIAALHCGWRSLQGGIIEKAIPLFHSPAAKISAWLGPAIGPKAFEVGAEVRAQFLALDGAHEAAFKAHGEKFLADLSLLATQKLQGLGVTSIADAQQCTYSLAEQYFSYRRDGQTGRMASVIWRK